MSSSITPEKRKVRGENYNRWAGLRDTDEEERYSRAASAVPRETRDRQRRLWALLSAAEEEELAEDSEASLREAGLEMDAAFCGHGSHEWSEGTGTFEREEYPKAASAEDFDEQESEQERRLLREALREKDKAPEGIAVYQIMRGLAPVSAVKLENFIDGSSRTEQLAKWYREEKELAEERLRSAKERLREELRKRTGVRYSDEELARVARRG